MAKLVVGKNDLATLHPEIAAEADGWDPSTVTAGIEKKMPWKCEKGHTWVTGIAYRIEKRRKTSCPYCCNQKVWTGYNDLQTKFPEVAAEADGWDPSTIGPNSNKKVSWKCKKGHTWEISPAHRTFRGSGCPFCANRKVWIGHNDLKTKFPEVAKEADGWDPSTVLSGTNKKMTWKCELQHTWIATVVNRTGEGKTGCPYCSGNKVWAGFNDLKTKFPEIAKEADGWDPSTVTPSSTKKKLWKCKKGHTWDAPPHSRTNPLLKSGCPVCANKKVLVGYNDLKTKFPEVAKEADGWDPSTVLPFSSKKKSWKCKKGHSWDAAVGSRTNPLLKSGCPYCSNYKVLVGYNDLQTKFPEIAKEADGWDPTTMTHGSDTKMPWKCNKGHTYRAQISNRTTKNQGCPYCVNRKLWVGYNDFQTKFPEIAKEAEGWDPAKVLFGNRSRRKWKCNKGHSWNATITNRTQHGSGCPICAETGFNPDKPAWFYLMKRPNEQQLGITNVLKDRMRTHKADVWVEIEVTVPHSGQEVLDTEDALKKWLKAEVVLVHDKTENWYTSKMEVHSLAELKEKSGIETTIF